MNHDTAIPHDLHVGTRDSVKESLGVFWSSVFSDQDLVDAGLASRVLSAAQLYIDVMEALSLRDHRGIPVFHREHWHPIVIRLSEQNTGNGLVIGMKDKAVIGKQTNESNPGHVYKDGELFEVGGNALFSKVNTYPFTAIAGCDLVRVDTCICDSISSPSHVLVKDRDFDIRDGVLVIRKEQDPFTVSGYRIVDDGHDRVAVLWACDAMFDTNNVADFIGYPLGIDVRSTEASARMVSALWDVVIYGVTPRYLNAVLGAVFDIPVVSSDTRVERVSDPVDGVITVVTGDAVYRVADGHLADAIHVGAQLSAGDFITNDLDVYHGLSQSEFDGLVDRGTIGSLYLPPGSIAGVDSTVVVENRESALVDGSWFKLSDGDSVSSAFWSSVHARVSADDVVAVFNKLKGANGKVNPLRSLGYTVMSNMIFVRTSHGLCSDSCASIVLSALSRLVPSYAGMLVLHELAESDAVSSDDSVEHTISQVSTSELGEPADSVSFRFIPVAETEV